MPNPPDWPPEFDALQAAPQHHTLLLENEFVRVLDTRIPPGQTVPPHTHQWPSTVYFISSSHFVRRDAQGNVVVDSRTIGSIPEETALWSAPLPLHTLENVGTTELRTIAVELKIHSRS
jgi:hypothetical protein